MSEPTKWRILVVEDQAEIGQEIVDALQAEGWLDTGTAFDVQLITSFAVGLAELAKSKFDLLILDLKDDSTPVTAGDPERAKPGLDLLAEIKRTRFVPVVFYTGLPAQVGDLPSAFVRVVEKTEGVMKVREAVREVLATRLPELSRYLEEQQRNYFWEFVEKEWEAFRASGQTIDLAYLMARRLAAGLESQFSRIAAETVGGEGATPSGQYLAHPMEYYIFPPVEKSWKTGDLLRRRGTNDYAVVLTPTCDFAMAKAAYFLTARCVPVTECEEYGIWRGTDSPPVFGGNPDKLKTLMRDGKERFTFLPGTWEFPDLFVDLQQIASLPLIDQAVFDRVASMDSPFAEKLLARFARFYGRVGTPDLDIDLALDRAKTRALRSSGES